MFCRAALLAWRPPRSRVGRPVWRVGSVSEGASRLDRPQLLAGLLYLGAGIGLAIGQAGRSVLGIRASEAPLRRGDISWLIAIVMFGGVIGPLFLMLGLARTSAASGSLLLNLEGLATMAVAWVIYRENVDRRLLLGAASILAGAVLLSWQGQGLRVDGGGLLIAVACLALGIDKQPDAETLRRPTRWSLR